MSDRTVIRTDAAPAPFQGAPYNQAIASGGFVFVSGQLGLKPGETALPDGIVAQTTQVLANLAAILGAAGSGPEHIVKTTVFLKDFADFAQMNELYKGFAGDSPPARSTVQVAKLPSDALIEIEAIARIP
jgi:2-iminobutanoate/2-iminopropanoate deaminase